MKPTGRRVCGVLLTLALAGGARAESAPGNSLDPSGGDTTRISDPRGLSNLRSVRRRSPAGFLYPDPLIPDRLFPLRDGWLYGGALELGGLWTSGDDDETRFVEFSDWSEGPWLESFRFALAHPDSGFFAEADGGGAGRDDQYYTSELGIPGLVRLRGSFSGVPHVFATDATQLYDGAGTNDLRLPPPLTPGANSDAELVAALAERSERTLSLQRDHTRVSLDYRPFDPVSLFARYSFDDRSGERPFGGSLIFDTGSGPARVVETSEPRDHRTHRFAGGVRYAGKGLLANLEYEGSWFRNADRSLTWDNPFSLGSSAGAENVTRGRFALAPDNDWHSIKGETSVPLPWDGRFTTTASWSRARQNDELVAPTVNSGVVGIPGLNAVDLDRWNSTDALARSRADAQVDTLLLDARLQLRPWKPLRLRAGVRYFDQSNDTRYTAHNPATGELGYVAEDGAHAVLTPFSRSFIPGVGTPSGAGTDDFRYRSSPYDYDKLEAELGSDTELLGRTTASTRYRFEVIHRDERERDETREHQARVSLTSRDLRWATLRTAYEYRRRDGDPYDPFPNRDDYVSSLDGYTSFLGFLPPFTLAQLRKYDLADRDRHDASLRANFLPRDDLDVSLALRYVDDDYGDVYGLRAERWGNVNAELNFQPSPAAQVYVFGSFEKRWSRIAGINDSFAFSSDPDAGGPVFPFENAWRLDSDETTWSAGTGLRLQAHPRVLLDLHYVFLDSRGESDFDIASAGALGTSLSKARDLPDLRTVSHQLQTSVRVAISEHVALRFFHRFDHSTIRDFSQRGLVPGEVLESSGALFLGHVDRDFSAHVFGLSLQLRR
jgi:MtrB/PioB family decaheme-associated outer membrane protein